MPRSISARSIAHLSAKRRWSVDEARTVLERVSASGLTVRDFAEGEGVDPQRLYRWRSVIGERSSPTFVEVRRPTPTRLPTHAPRPSAPPYSEPATPCL